MSSTQVVERILKQKPIIQNGNIITWAFDIPTEVTLFKSAQCNDVIRSPCFTINGCKFYLELTPNGWSEQQGTLIWCALHELCENVIAGNVCFEYTCNAISFSGSWTQLMTTQALVSQIKNALNSATSNSASFQLFNNVNAFTFRCVIKVTHFYDRNGNQVRYNISGC
eukprot:901823_1